MSGSSEANFFPPVLQNRASHGRIYSDRALFYTAIVGGATPAILLAIANATALGRWRMDWWRFVVAILAAALLLPFGFEALTSRQLPDWLSGLPNGGGMSLVRWATHLSGILIALFLWAPIIRIYNHAYNTANTRTPWKMAIACLVVAGAIEYAVTGHAGFMIYWLLL